MAALPATQTGAVEVAIHEQQLAQIVEGSLSRCTESSEEQPWLPHSKTLPEAHYLRALAVPASFMEHEPSVQERAWLAALCCVRTRVEAWPEHYMRAEGFEEDTVAAKLVHGESGHFEYFRDAEDFLSVVSFAYETICNDPVYGETDCKRARRQGCTPEKFLNMQQPEQKGAAPASGSLQGQVAPAALGLGLGLSLGTLFLIARRNQTSTGRRRCLRGRDS